MATNSLRVPRHLVALHRALGIPADYAVTRELSLQREPRRLVSAGVSPSGRRLLLTPRAAAAWRRMRAAAARDRIEPIAISGFRSIARQTRLIRAKLAGGEAIADILRLVAAPGYSEHHTGRALDLGCTGYLELETGFERTPTYRWLARHAQEFGFTLSFPRANPHGIAYEPWHWCWHPPSRDKKGNRLVPSAGSSVSIRDIRG